MSKTSKTIIWAVVIVAIIIFAASLMKKPSMQENGDLRAPGENGQGKNMPAMSAPNDSSDEALDQDTASIEAKINAIEAAQASGPENNPQ